MARADAKCQECGSKKTLFGRNVDEALRKVEWWEKKVRLCADCEVAEKYKADKAKAEELELPDLTGTEAQVKLATSVRVSVINELILYSNPENWGDQEAADAALVLDHIAKIDKASWWLDNRSGDTLFFIQRNAAMIRRPLHPAHDPVAIDLANLDATIRPEDPCSELIADIKIGLRDFSISFPERDDDFNSVLKLYGAKWNGGDKSWDFDPGTHPVADLAAEVGAHLLAEEYIIRVHDEDVRGLIQSGEFQKSDGRKIDWHGDEKIRVDWRRIDGDYYDEVKGVKGASWDKPLQTILIPVSMADEIRDFAGIYGFTISPRAEAAFEQYDEYRRSGMVVSGTKRKKGKAERIIDESKLPTGEIHTDLLDA